MEFSATGRIITEKGMEIDFNAELDLQKQMIKRTTLSFTAGGDVADPLVFSFNGENARLTANKYDFDIDADGEKEKISFVDSGQGILVFDKNRNQKIDDGREVVGAVSGDAFGDLRRYDTDQNNWIDENDDIFNQLQIWIKEGSKDVLKSLKDAHVGAIYLGNTDTEFDIGEGILRQTGIFVKENGDVNILQKIDLKV